MALPALDPHAGQPVLRYGPSPSHARLSVILLHGRGDSAEGILELARALDLNDVAYLAPQAAGYTWYPLGEDHMIRADELTAVNALLTRGSTR